uniref:hypothetical protein n=1 Tax=Paractinoplanes polyasparticus TaxID=2856853 RepID=UPI001C85DF42|nr:hypothetical protein [Actinoplanes polyasparticus]
MSVAAVTAPPASTVTALPIDQKGWLGWLAENTPLDWRPDEWDGRHWLFTGDPESAATAIWRCNSAGCHVAVRASRHLCRACYEQFLDSGLNREEFATTGRRALVRSLPGSRPSCTVEREGVRCALEASVMGACELHYKQWRYKFRRSQTELELAAWLRVHAEPRPVGVSCRVGGCAGTSSARVSLCTYHRERWRRHRREKGLTDADLDCWTASQAPRLTGFQFSLVGLPELLRHEVLYALAQRDAQRPTLSPIATRLVVRTLAEVDSIAALTDTKLRSLSYDDRNGDAHWNDIVRLIRAAFHQFRGVDPLDQPVWELSDLGLPSRTRAGIRINPRRLDVTQLRQDWLRRLLAVWVKEANPDNVTFRRTFEGCLSASRALTARPGGGHDPGALKITDMDAVVAAIRDRQRKTAPANCPTGLDPSCSPPSSTCSTSVAVCRSSTTSHPRSPAIRTTRSRTKTPPRTKPARPSPNWSSPSSTPKPT